MRYRKRHAMLEKASSVAVLLLLVFLLSPISSSMAGAGEIFPGKWWRIPQISDDLRLNEEQKQELDLLFRNSRVRLVKLKSVLERERNELERLLGAEPLDEAVITAQFKKLEAARADLAAERFQFLLEVRKNLGSERFQRLKTLIQELREKKMPRTPALPDKKPNP
jgi:Spy/CpxP family protein refolding chaperone